MFGYRAVAQFTRWKWSIVYRKLTGAGALPGVPGDLTNRFQVSMEYRSACRRVESRGLQQVAWSAKICVPT